MRYARIIDIHVPLNRTDLVFKCTEYEVPLIKAKWENTPQRAKDRPIAVNPMPINGEHDPFRPVEDVEREMRRVMTVHGSKIFKETYPTELFAERFEKLTLEQNPWSVARAKAAAEAEAERQGLAAAATAKLVHEAIEARVHADAEVAAKRIGRATADQDQADKDREALASVGVKDEDLVGSVAGPTTHTPKGRKA